MHSLAKYCTLTLTTTTTTTITLTLTLQVHFLAKYWAEVRGDEWQRDAVAEVYFPFISAPRFTLRTFARTPSLWFWFTKDWQDFDIDFLREEAPPPAQK